MNELTQLCGGDVAALDLDGLRDACRGLTAAFAVQPLEAVLMAALALVGFAAVASTRRGAGIGKVLGNGLEGAAYGALGFFAGAGFGVFAAEIVPPLYFAVFILGHCIVACVWVGLGVRGEDADADASSKATAIALGLLLLGAGILVLVAAIAVPREGPAGDGYRRYLNTVAIVLGLLGGIDGIITAGTRGVHWAVGWLLVPLNASWGFLGNILGLGNHVASYLCFRSTSAPRGGDLVTDRRAVHLPYTLYKRGLTLKREHYTDPATGSPKVQRFAFTQGWVVSCEHGGDVERHEFIHVIQHLVLGPVYFLSHAVWDFIGFITGALASLGPADFPTAVTNMAYYNNPYEIVAYASHDGARDTATPYVLRSPWSGIFAVTWIVAAIAVFLVLVLVVWS